MVPFFGWGLWALCFVCALDALKTPDRIVVRLRMGVGAPNRASQRMTVDMGKTQWDAFLRGVRERLSLPPVAYPALTLLDPHGNAVASLERLPRHTGSVVTVVSSLGRPSSSSTLLAQLQPAVNAMYQVLSLCPISNPDVPVSHPPTP